MTRCEREAITNRSPGTTAAQLAGGIDNHHHHHRPVLLRWHFPMGHRAAAKPERWHTDRHGTTHTNYRCDRHQHTDWRGFPQCNTPADHYSADQFLPDGHPDAVYSNFNCSLPVAHTDLHPADQPTTAHQSAATDAALDHRDAAAVRSVMQGCLYARRPA
jgi:hypothetical protein